MIAGLVAYLTGYGLGFLFSSRLGLSVVVALVGIGLAAGWWADLPRTALTVIALLILTGASGGLGNPRPLPPNHLLYHLPKEPTTLEGWVAGEPVPLRGNLQVRLRAEWLGEGGYRRPVAGDCLIKLPSKQAAAYGQRLRLKGLLLSRPRGYANPGGFDFRAFLARQKIYVVGRLGANGALTKSPGRHPSASAIKWTVSRWRARMLDDIERALPGGRGAVLQAIVLGARERLSSEIRRYFRNTGTAHLLAISGLHVGFIAVAVFWALRGLLRAALRIAPETWGVRFAPSRWAALGTAPATLFYALLVGGRVSTVRATIMVLAYLASRIYRVPRNHFHALALAALIVLVWDPEAMGDIGFQLSFTAVTAILLALRWLGRSGSGPLPTGERTWRRRLAERVGLCLLVSMVAFLATWPLIARTFHRIALIGPLANALVFPIASLTIPLGLAAAMFSLVLPAAAKILLTPAGWGASLLLATLEAMARLSFSNMMISAPSGLVLIVYYGILACLLVWPLARHRGWLALAAGLLVVGATATAAIQSHHAAGRLTITAFDAGRAQAILLWLPDGRRLLWFGAPPNGSSSVVRQVVIPSLLHQRVGTLHGLIAANNTGATVKGIVSLVRAVKVKRLWIVPGAYGKLPLPLRKAIYRLALPVKPLRAGWSEPCGRMCTINVLWPEPEAVALRGSAVYGPVLHVRYKKRAALLTGDSSHHVERALLAHPESLGATLLQIPKAGSRFASSGRFIRRVAPKLAMLAARAPPSWRKDVEKTLARYQRAGITLWRVDRDGALTWWTDGRDSSIGAVRFNGGGFPHPHPERALARDLSR